MLVRFVSRDHPRPWNKGLLVGQKKPLQPKHVWSIRVRLEIAHMWRDLALFNLAIDSKLRACDLVKLRIDEVCSGAMVRDRATVVQKKTGRPVQFEITEQTRASLEVWLRILRATGSRYLFPSRLHARPHLSTRQYSRLVHRWAVEEIHIFGIDLRAGQSLGYGLSLSFRADLGVGFRFGSHADLPMFLRCLKDWRPRHGAVNVAGTAPPWWGHPLGGRAGAAQAALPGTTQLN
jgi:integrase-like protein